MEYTWNDIYILSKDAGISTSAFADLSDLSRQSLYLRSAHNIHRRYYQMFELALGEFKFNLISKEILGDRILRIFKIISVEELLDIKDDKSDLLSMKAKTIMALSKLNDVKSLEVLLAIVKQSIGKKDNQSLSFIDYLYNFNFANKQPKADRKTKESELIFANAFREVSGKNKLKGTEEYDDMIIKMIENRNSENNIKIEMMLDTLKTDKKDSRVLKNILNERMNKNNQLFSNR